MPRGRNKSYKTHCKNGHDLTLPDSYYESKRPDGSRLQRICKLCHKKHTAGTEKTDKQKAYRKQYYAETRGAFWRKYSVLQSVAKKLKRDFTLTLEDYIALVVADACSYCGSKLPEVGYGVDRKDNRMGYVHGNVVACCESCNEKKGSLEGVGFVYPRTEELLLELLKK